MNKGKGSDKRNERDCSRKMAKGKVVLGQILKYPKNHLAGTFPTKWDSLEAGERKKEREKESWRVWTKRMLKEGALERLQPRVILNDLDNCSPSIRAQEVA